MSGPYGELHIYEIEGDPGPLPALWRSMGFLGCWQEAGFSYLFFSAPRREMLEGFLSHHACRAILRSATTLPYEDWEAGAPLEPFRVGRLWVVPPWQKVQPGAGEMILVLDPGVCFGSGYHASTRVSLEILVDLYRTATPRSVLDLGTGTGILGLAAARLGARRVLAVDLQPLAVETAQANARRNSLAGRVEVRLADALGVLGEPADLLIANLTYEALCPLLERPEIRTKAWGIFSGLVGRQVHWFKERLASAQLQMADVRSENLWFTVLARPAGICPRRRKVQHRCEKT